MKQTPKDRQVLQRLGHNIKQLRMSRGLTQEKLAELCGRSKDAVSHWESGMNMPPPGCLLTLIEVFHVSWGTLFHGVGADLAPKGE